MRIRDLVLDFRAAGQAGGRSLFRALDHVSLDIAEDEILGLVGESGSAKTTLGKTILGVHRPCSGSILYRDRDLATLPPAQWAPFRCELQMVFQDPLSSFNPRFTIGSSLTLPLRLHEICPPERIDDEVGSLLTRVGLSHEHAARYPHELSGGQLQRVAIARALSLVPRLIVADKAVSKLDVSVRAQVLNLLKRMNRETGVAIVFITHDLGVARFLCDRIAVMFFGRIVETGPTERIFGDPQHPYTRSLIAARHGGAKGVATDADEVELAIPDMARACNFASRCGRRMSDCLSSRPALRDLGDRHRVACFSPISAGGGTPASSEVGDGPGRDAGWRPPTRWARSAQGGGS
jgi:oligopeptide/dipeptide ABC transporter ATP-binding protein